MYKVVSIYGGEQFTIYDPLSSNFSVFNDELETETNSPGMFKFDLNGNPNSNKIVGLSSDIRVYDGDEELWRGRPIDDGTELHRTTTFKCEGELAFLYDSIQPRRELHNISPYDFLKLLLDEHNDQVAGKGPIDKTFEAGIVTVTDSNNSLYRYTNRETTFDCIKKKLIDRLGGYLEVRVSGGKRYIDWIDSATLKLTDQKIWLGRNLLSFVENTDYTQVATACIPLGARLETTEIAALDAYLTVADVNNDSDVIQIASAVERYGYICKVLHFDDITVPANLKAAGEQWLTKEQFANAVLKVTAVDLHNVGYDIRPLRINTKVDVDLFGFNTFRSFPITKRSYHLSNPETDSVVLGIDRKMTYTTSIKKSIEAASKKII